MKLQAATIAVLLCASGAAAAAQQIDLSLNSDTALLRYTLPISYSTSGRTDADFGLLHTESNDPLLMAGITMLGEAGSQVPGLDGGVGFRAYGISMDNGADIGAVTLGGMLKYVPPALNRVGLVAALNYAPNVTVTGDANRLWDFTVRAEYEVLPMAAVYIGYRDVGVRMEINSRDITLDQGAHFGLRMSF